MIVQATPDMLPALIKIWVVAFGDPPAHIEFIFDNLLSPADILVKVDDRGSPAATLVTKEVRFISGGQSFAGAYVMGVATLPKHRGKGYASALVQEADVRLKAAGRELACLLPANMGLFDFYAARGYHTKFYYKLLEVTGEGIPTDGKGGVLSPALLEDLAALRAKAFAGSALFGEWDADFLRYHGKECRFFGGEVLRFSHGGGQGYLVCYPKNPSTILVKEAVLPGGEVEPLLTALHARYRAKNYQIRLPSDLSIPEKWGARTLPFGMVKWYDETLPQKIAGGAPWFALGLDD